MTKPLRILQLCNKPPLPSVDGGTIAMRNISRGLIDAGQNLKILSISTHKHPYEEDKIPAEFLESSKMESVYIDTRLNLVDAFSSLITRDSYNITRFFSPDFDRKLQDVLEKDEYDIVHLESLFMTPYIPTCRRSSKAKIVLRSHNLEYIIWERMASGEGNIPKKTYLKYLAKKLKDYELSIINQVDGIVSISTEDLSKYQQLGCDKPTMNIPFGIDFEKFKKYNDKEYSPTFNLFHIGSMDWSPNFEAIVWFLNEVWPNLISRFPDLRLSLAGRNMPKDLKKENHPNVDIIGEVEDAYEFMKKNGVMVVPLLSAGGIRVKIIEGMALGKAVISTKIGAEGIDYTDRKDIFIANTTEEMIEVINEIIKNKQFANTVGINAQNLIREKYDNNMLIKDLIKFYQDIS